MSDCKCQRVYGPTNLAFNEMKEKKIAEYIGRAMSDALTIDQLKQELAQAKAQLWVAKDAQLRTYDGLVQENSALKELVGEASNIIFDKYEQIPASVWFEKAKALIGGDE